MLLDDIYITILMVINNKVHFIWAPEQLWWLWDLVDTAIYLIPERRPQCSSNRQYYYFYLCVFMEHICACYTCVGVPHIAHMCTWLWNPPHCFLPYVWRQYLSLKLELISLVRKALVSFKNPVASVSPVLGLQPHTTMHSFLCVGSSCCVQALDKRSLFSSPSNTI